MPESLVKVCDDDIKVEVLDISASRQLVAEMMILTGEVAARYGEAHKLAMPFRSQPQPELPSKKSCCCCPTVGYETALFAAVCLAVRWAQRLRAMPRWA